MWRSLRMSERERRWEAEAAFFDRNAEVLEDVEPLDPLAIRRYARRPLRRRFGIEYMHHLAGGWEGKRVLDIGCGEGRNSVLFALLGAAEVVGIDVSPKAIDVARRLAEVNGVTDRVRFTCAPLETSELSGESFDIIWCQAFLHHVLAEYDAVLVRLGVLLHPDGVLVIKEPVNLAPWLRKLRLLVPVKVVGTPDERPLERDEIGSLEREFPGLEARMFRGFGRLDRFLLIAGNYERSPALRRWLSSLLAYADWSILAVPGLRSLGSVLIAVARRPEETP